MAGEAVTFESFAAAIAPHKATLSETGWLYLINDTNDFLRTFFGLDVWSPDEEHRAVMVVRDRVNALQQRGIAYRKVIVPEKPVIYPEHLNLALQGLPRAPRRPARILMEGAPSEVFYLEAFLNSVKGLGQLYFRGDTHTNWFGGWLVYRFVIHVLHELGLPLAGRCFDLAQLAPKLAVYSGDLPPHLSTQDSKLLNERFGFAFPQGGVEHTVQYEVPESQRKARRVATPADYERWYDSRETFVFERHDGIGPTAVFFRDSTFDRGVMELVAEHFARSVFVWHLGLVDEDVLDRERPALVLQSMAERFVARYPEFPPLFQAGAHRDAVELAAKQTAGAGISDGKYLEKDRTLIGPASLGSSPLNSMRTLFLHVGFPKCGSTSLQEALRDAKQISFPSAGRLAGAPEHLALALKFKGIDAWTRQFVDEAWVDSEFQRLLLEIAAAESPIVLSSERLASLSEIQLDALRATFSEFRLRIILMTRELDLYINSTWRDLVFQRDLEISLETLRSRIRADNPFITAMDKFKMFPDVNVFDIDDPDVVTKLSSLVGTTLNIGRSNIGVPGEFARLLQEMHQLLGSKTFKSIFTTDVKYKMRDAILDAQPRVFDEFEF